MVDLLKLGFRMALMLLQAYIIWRMTMHALGRG